VETVTAQALEMAVITAPYHVIREFTPGSTPA
jgi:hypothetical protein